ncbi:MAG: TPM domain-containing protein, partial [Verrucomicrobiota bacterium]|nr:TPM domain-containing protein [Verrucomicrobiota bacterium]
MLSSQLGRTWALLLAVCLFGAGSVTAAEVMPPKPAGYFNDNAGVVSKEAALQFNEQLAQFERETSNQIVVAVFRKMETDSSIEDYTQRIAQSWGVGQADRRNGAALFVFVDDRKMFVQVGYGLEGVIPDVTAFDITERHIKPKFRNNDYEGGLAAGIDLLMKAARGEYTGTGKTVAESSTEEQVTGSGCIL